MTTHRGIIADHPQRNEIEQAIRVGLPVRAVARQFGIKNFSTVARYRRNLLARDGERERADEAKSDVDRLVERLDSLWDLLTKILKDRYGNKKFDATTIKAISEARATVREIANVKGLLKPAVQIGIGVNVTNQNGGGNAATGTTVPPDEVKRVLFSALRKHPEARDAVVADLLALQSRYDGTVIDAEVVDEPAEH